MQPKAGFSKPTPVRASRLARRLLAATFRLPTAAKSAAFYALKRLKSTYLLKKSELIFIIIRRKYPTGISCCALDSLRMRLPLAPCRSVPATRADWGRTGGLGTNSSRSSALKNAVPEPSARHQWAARRRRAPARVCGRFRNALLGKRPAATPAFCVGGRALAPSRPEGAASLWEAPASRPEGAARHPEASASRPKSPASRPEALASLWEGAERQPRAVASEWMGAASRQMRPARKRVGQGSRPESRQGRPAGK